MPDGALHAAQTGANLHIAIRYIAASDPYVAGVTKAYDLWLDTTGGSGAWILKVRNAGNSAWEVIAKGVTATQCPVETWTTSNSSADRSFDADATTLNELADVVATLIADLKTAGILG
jgi:hypothetical protein